jgi:hypothetical protein
MSPAQLILAAVLLAGSGPAEIRDPAALQQQFPALRVALVSLALEWEILDPREIRYVLAREEDLASDLRMLQRRYQELADAPFLCDAFRFPERSAVNELLVFNRAYRNYLEIRQPMQVAQGGYLRAVLKEVDHLYTVWDTVRDARCEYYYVTVRRQALKHLRELVGEESYYKGELPPHVPVWRFESLN